MQGNRVTDYLWYDFATGEVSTESGRVIDIIPSIDFAASLYPAATFRVYNVDKTL